MGWAGNLTGQYGGMYTKIDQAIFGSQTEMSIYTSLTPKPDALIRHPIGVH